MDIETQVREVLDKLGSNPDQIAESLLNKGCIADLSQDYRCPLDIYIEGEFTGYTAVAGNHSVAVLDNHGSAVSVRFSEAHRDFTIMFDTHKYPQLIEGS